MDSTVEELLDALAETEALRDKLRLERAEAEEIAMRPVRKALDDIEAEYKPNEDLANDTIADIKKSIEAAVLAGKSSKKGKHKTAVYFSGRVTWETKPLEGLAAIYPELNKFKKVGAPYVVIQNAKGGE